MAKTSVILKTVMLAGIGLLNYRLPTKEEDYADMLQSFDKRDIWCSHADSSRLTVGLMDIHDLKKSLRKRLNILQEKLQDRKKARWQPEEVAQYEAMYTAYYLDPFSALDLYNGPQLNSDIKWINGTLAQETQDLVLEAAKMWESVVDLNISVVTELPDPGADDPGGNLVIWGIMTGQDGGVLKKNIALGNSCARTDATTLKMLGLSQKFTNGDYDKPKALQAAGHGWGHVLVGLVDVPDSSQGSPMAPLDGLFEGTRKFKKITKPDVLAAQRQIKCAKGEEKYCAQSQQSQRSHFFQTGPRYLLPFAAFLLLLIHLPKKRPCRRAGSDGLFNSRKNDRRGEKKIKQCARRAAM